MDCATSSPKGKLFPCLIIPNGMPAYCLSPSPYPPPRKKTEGGKEQKEERLPCGNIAQITSFLLGDGRVSGECEARDIEVVGRDSIGCEDMEVDKG